MEDSIIQVIGTAIITAILTSYSTSKANERILKTIMDRIDELEARIFNHENRISRLEGSVKA